MPKDKYDEIVSRVVVEINESSPMRMASIVKDALREAAAEAWTEAAKESQCWDAAVSGSAYCSGTNGSPCNGCMMAARFQGRAASLRSGQGEACRVHPKGCPDEGPHLAPAPKRCVTCKGMGYVGDTASPDFIRCRTCAPLRRPGNEA